MVCDKKFNQPYLLPIELKEKENDLVGDVTLTITKFGNSFKEETLQTIDFTFILAGTFITLKDELTSIIDIFTTIEQQNSKEYHCYIDKANKPKTHYINIKKDVIKMQDKPIVLVLKNDKDIKKKIVEYRRKSGNIEYAFSWVVRGHYRTLQYGESIGKDRNGDYNQQGRTWVKTHYRGNLDAPILKRETIVIDGRH